MSAPSRSDENLIQIIKNLRKRIETLERYTKSSEIGTNRIADDAINYTKVGQMPTCRLYDTNATQTISTSTTTPITFDSEAFDNGGFHSTVSNTSRITIPTGYSGIYIITGSVRWTGDASTAPRMLAIRQAGVANLAAVRWNGTGGVAVLEQNVATLASLSASTYVELTVYHTKGSDLTIASDTNTNFTAAWISGQ